MQLVEFVPPFLIACVAVLHSYFLILEMFLWTRPTGLRTFRMSATKANETKTLAANQGLYNGFLAAGLFWSLVHPDRAFGHELALFFLGCVLVAALYGGATVGRQILWIQGLPAVLGLVAVYSSL